jgi:hypothetical protein
LKSYTTTAHQKAQSWIKAGNIGLIGWQGGDGRRGSSLKDCFEVITTVTNKGIKISFLG